MKAVIYTRFSPRRNAEESESCETQKQLCELYCKEKNYKVVDYFEDRAMSGADEDRPGLWLAVNAIKKGMVLIVYRADRLARDVYLFECIRRSIDKNGGSIEYVNGGNGTSPEDIMIRQVLAAFSEYERKVIAIRTSVAMSRHQANGRRMGRWAPYGYKIDPSDKSKLIEDQIEQQSIKYILEEVAKGTPLKKIVTLLGKGGYPCRDRHWTLRLVNSILKRQKQIY